jgi:hypothetical protein
MPIPPHPATRTRTCPARNSAALAPAPRFMRRSRVTVRLAGVMAALATCETPAGGDVPGTSAYARPSLPRPITDTEARLLDPDERILLSRAHAVTVCGAGSRQTGFSATVEQVARHVEAIGGSRDTGRP